MAGGIGGILGSSSGLDTAAIIEAIMSAKQRPIDAIQGRIDKAEDQKRGFLDISSRLLTIQEVAKRIYNGTTFSSSIVQSSQPGALLATGTSSAFEGTFQFFTHSLASVAQYVSTGFRDTNVEKISPVAGDFTVEVGNARVQRETDLERLNGSTGIDRGKIRVTDDAGRSALIDLTNVISIGDVVDAINNNGIAQVSARINDLAGSGALGDGLIISNNSGAGTVTVENVGFGSTATSLGIAGSNAGGTLVGTRVNTIGRATALAVLNDGRGVGDGQSTLGSISITGSGGAFSVDVTNARTIGDVIDFINAAGGSVTASISDDGTAIKLSDAGMPASITVTGSSATVNALGLNAGAILDMGGGEFTGRRLIASMNSVLMQSLGGVNRLGIAGSLTSPASFDIVDSMGGVTTLNYTGREDLYALVNRINNPGGPGANVRARVDASGTGIEILDNAGGGGTLTMTDTVGTLAADLGLAGAHADGVADAGNLNFRHFHGNLALTEFGFPVGIQTGSIEVTLRNGSQSRVDLTAARTVGDVVNALNQIPQLTARINQAGDGYEFIDASGGTGPLVFRDVSGTFARKLNFLGTFNGAGATIEQKFEYTINVDTTDTLNDVSDKLRGLNIPAVVTIVNDGSAFRPFRLSITSEEPGAHNDIVVKSDLAALGFNQTSSASDAVMLYGSSAGGSDPVVVRSATNTFKNVLAGVTLDLLSLSNTPVSVSITRDLQAASNDINELIDSYNSLAERLDELAGFNTETLKGGPLLGDNTLSGLEFALSRALLDIIDGLPLGAATLASLGVDITNEGRLELDNDKLLDALENRLSEVKDIFSHSGLLTPDTKFKSWNSGGGLKTSNDGADIRITFRDGSADLLLDLSNFDELDQLLDAINNDGRASIQISPDQKKLVIRDLTAGAGSFSINDLNNSGTVASLGLVRTTPLPGDDKIESKSIQLNTELGVARRVDNALKQYTDRDGLIEDATEAIDGRIDRFNEDIERINERVDVERERLERQFAAMEATLADSQQTATMLQQTLQSLNNNNKK